MIGCWTPPAPGRTQYVDRDVTIHEHRAPTDQSVKLLREMEKAARDKVEQSIRVSDNGFECVVHVMHNGFEHETIARAIFKLNGKEMRAEVRERMLGHQPKVEAIVDLHDKLRDEVARVIANEVLNAAFLEAWKR